MSWHQVFALLRLPHRGSATPLEAEAFRRLRALLEERGLAPAAIPFRGVPSYGWELLFISLLLALTPFSPLFPLLGALGFLLSRDPPLGLPPGPLSLPEPPSLEG
jgi:hypothetical protein